MFSWAIRLTKLQLPISLLYTVLETWIHLQDIYSIDRSIMHYVFHAEMTDFIFLVLQAPWQRG